MVSSKHVLRIKYKKIGIINIEIIKWLNYRNKNITIEKIKYIKLRWYLKWRNSYIKNKIKSIKTKIIGISSLGRRNSSIKIFKMSLNIIWKRYWS